MGQLPQEVGRYPFRSECGTCCGPPTPPKQVKDPKTFEKLYSSHLKIADLVQIPDDVSFQPVGVVCIM